MSGPWMGGLTVRRTERGQTPICDHICPACGFHRRITGRDRVADYLRSNPIHEHRTVCEGAS